MKKFIIIKTFKEEISPDVIGIKDTMTEALSVVYKDVVETGSYYTLEEIEKEFNNEGYFDLRGYRYSIIKYWE